MLRHYKHKTTLVPPMPARYRFRLAEITVASLLALAVYFSWRADRRDRSQLESELAATKQLLAAADARLHDRDNQLAQTLASLAAEKRTIVIPAQIVRELPSQISLPSHIVLQSAPASPNSPPPWATSPTNARKPPHSCANATTLCASLEAVASGAAADAAKTAH